MKRERERLDGIGREISERFRFERRHVAPSWAARLRGLAAATDGISAATLRRLADERLGLSLPRADVIVEAASQLPFWVTNESHQDGYIEPVRPDLFAAALLADILQQAKNLAPALAAIQQAVDIRRRLSREVPWRYSRYLALSLASLVTDLRRAKLPAGAIAANEEVTALLGKLLPANPAQFGPDLLRSLRLHAELLQESGRHEEAVERRAAEVGLFDHLTQLGAIRMDPEALLEIGTSLGNSAYDAAQHGLLDTAARAYTRAIDLLESIRRRNPSVWDGRLSYVKALLHLHRGHVLPGTGDRQTRLAEYSQGVALLEDCQHSSGGPPDAPVMLALARTHRAVEFLKGGAVVLAVTDWEAARDVELHARSGFGSPWPPTKHLDLIRSLRDLHSLAITRGELGLADGVSEQMAGIAAEIRSHDHDEVDALADILIRHGASHCDLGKTAGMAPWLREGIACAEAALAAGKAPAEPPARTLFFNNLAYGIAWLVELTGETKDLEVAEGHLRDGLLSLGSSEHNLQRFETLDTLAYVVLLEAQHALSCQRASESVELLNQALKLGYPASGDSLAIVQQRRQRALELQHELCSKPEVGSIASARKRTPVRGRRRRGPSPR